MTITNAGRQWVAVFATSSADMIDPRNDEEAIAVWQEQSDGRVVGLIVARKDGLVEAENRKGFLGYREILSVPIA